jgi:type III secretion protein J
MPARWGWRDRLRAFAWCAIATGALSGCTVPVVTDVDGPDANRIVQALANRGIAAEKVPNGADEHFRVDVGRDDEARASTTLGEEGLPPRKSTGMLDALGSGALVPSRAAEHERLLVGMSGELERTLGAVDGIVSARVHLAVPRRDVLSDEPATPATASVLLRYRGNASPLSQGDVQKLVTYAVPGLDPSRVFVITVAARASDATHDIERIGPLSATHATARKIRIALLLLTLLGLALVACLGILWRRARRPSHRSASRSPARALARSRD